MLGRLLGSMEDSRLQIFQVTETSEEMVSLSPLGSASMGRCHAGNPPLSQQHH